MKATSECSRPPLRYHGGKWRLAPWIIEHMPPHRIYVEPFGGAASVLLRKPRSYAEIYNDLDDEVVTLFRVLRDPVQAAELRRLVELTPFSRTEFIASYEPSDDPLERAHRLIVRSAMGYGSNAHNISVKTGFRASSHRSGTTPAMDWRHFGPALEAVTDRLRGVFIENRPAIEVMAQQDREDALHYLDPPYMHDVRSSRFEGRNDYHGYRHEMTAEQHQDLLAAAKELRGMVMISGYRTPLYDAELDGWKVFETDTFVLKNVRRCETIWLNAAAASALDRSRHSLITIMEMAT